MRCSCFIKPSFAGTCPLGPVHEASFARTQHPPLDFLVAPTASKFRRGRQALSLPKSRRGIPHACNSLGARIPRTHVINQKPDYSSNERGMGQVRTWLVPRRTWGSRSMSFDHLAGAGEARRRQAICPSCYIEPRPVPRGVMTGRVGDRHTRFGPSRGGRANVSQRKPPGVL